MHIILIIKTKRLHARVLRKYAMSALAYIVIIIYPAIIYHFK